MKPLAVDLCCGLGGWTHGLLAEGWDVVGFDIEQHVYGDDRYPAQLVLQDIRTLDGRQFRGKVSLITASPPCTEFSYMAMPWSRAKQIARALRDDGDFPDGYTGSRTVAELTALFDACVRIGREAKCPIVIENVRGAQPWVGRSRWNFGSFHLYGDVPALMPMTKAIKNNGGSWFNIGSPGQTELNRNPVHELVGRKVPGFRFDGSGGSFQTASVEGVKVAGLAPGRFPPGGLAQGHIDGTKNGNDWFGAGDDCSMQRRHGSKSSARKAASAAIAKIPFALARHIAAVYRPAMMSIEQ